MHQEEDFMPELAYVNGKIMPISEAAIPIEDRGYQFADAVYEVVASDNGKLFCLDFHLERLERSMVALHFPAVSIESIGQAIVSLFERAGIARAAVYVQISRGVAARNHAYDTSTLQPQIVMTVRPIHEAPAASREKGIRVVAFTDNRWGRCDIKTVQLLPNAMAKQAALDAGANDAIFVSKEGVVREGTSSNLFIVSGGTLFTHPLTPEILPGITRRVILDICRKLRLSVIEQFFTLEEALAADEMFLTGTIAEVMPVVAVDDEPIGDGSVGEISRKLHAELKDRMQGK
jgi:D-alanine transaminase